MTETAEKIRTTREASRGVACPDCGAQPGEVCFRPDTPSHTSRHELAVRHGAPRVERPAAKPPASGA